MTTSIASTDGSISNFVKWANDRIEREIQLNEECERQFGTAEVSSIRSKLSNYLSDEDKIKYIKEVDRVSKMYPHIKKIEICDMCNVHFTSYYKWQKQLTKKGLM